MHCSEILPQYVEIQICTPAVTRVSRLWQGCLSAYAHGAMRANSLMLCPWEFFHYYVAFDREIQ